MSPFKQTRGGKRSLMALLLVLAFLPLGAHAVEPGVRLDAKVRRSSDEPVRLSAFWGKPVVLFYESAESAKLNQAVKDELKRLVEHHQLRDFVDGIAVANLEG